MRIETSRKPRSYLNPKDQRRLLALVGVLIVVLIASRMAANPANWQWMFGGENVKTQQTGAKKSAPAQTASDPKLKSGEFRVSRSNKTEKTAAARSQKSETGNTQEPPSTDGRHKVTNYGPGPKIDPASVEIHSALLSAVEDRTWNVRPQEAGTYFSILEHATRVSQRDLQRVGRENVALTVLMSSPREYRGVVVTLDGELFQIRRLPDTLPPGGKAAASNSEKQPLYDAWIRPPGSDKTPYRVVFSELPEGVAAVEETRQFDPPVPVRATGYFFKVQKYEIDEDRDGFAPLVLAQRIRILKNPATSHRSISAAPYIVGFICFVLAALAFAIWRFSIGDKAFHEKHLERIVEPSLAEKVAMNDLPAEDPGDLFAHLAEADREAGKVS